MSGKGVPYLGRDQDTVRSHPPTGRSEVRREVPNGTKDLLRVTLEDLLDELLDHE